MLKPDAKIQRLHAHKVLNPRPQAVEAPWFHSGGFFDPNDLVRISAHRDRRFRHRDWPFRTIVTDERFGPS